MMSNYDAHLDKNIIIEYYFSAGFDPESVPVGGFGEW